MLRRPDSWLNKITFFLLWCVIVNIPFDGVLYIAGVGTAARILGFAALGAAVLAVTVRGRLQRIDGPACWVLAFGLWTLLSLLWTVSLDSTVELLQSIVRVLGLYWLLYEFANSLERLEKLKLAYVVGAFVAIAGVVWSGGGTEFGNDRHSFETAMGLMDPNNLALRIAVGIPIAWNLQSTTRSGTLRWLGRLFVPFAVVGVLLTGSRGGLLAAVTGLLLLARGLASMRFRTLVIVVVSIIVAMVVSVQVVPDDVFRRLQTLPSELTSGTLNLRTLIWGAGFEFLKAHPLLGLGAGAFPTEIYAQGAYPKTAVPHSVVLGILFELGPVGLLLFAGVLVSILRWTRFAPADQQWFCRILLLTWFIGSLVLSEEYSKFTWFVLGLATALVVSGKALRDAQREAAYATALEPSD